MRGIVLALARPFRPAENMVSGRPAKILPAVPAGP